jgi:hypothetical protein
VGTPTHEGTISWSDLIEMGRKEEEDEMNKRMKEMAINQCCHLGRRILHQRCQRLI